MTKSDLVLVAGAGGFIGGHCVAELRRRGHQRIRAVTAPAERPRHLLV